MKPLTINIDNFDEKYMNELLEKITTNLSSKNYERAIEYIDEVIKIFPPIASTIVIGISEKPKHYAFRANIYDSMKKYKLALADCNRAIIMKPSIHFYAHKINLLQKMGATIEEQLEVANKIVKIAPEYAMVYFVRATCYAEKNEFDKAKKDAKRALDIAVDKTEISEILDFLESIDDNN